MKRNNIYLAAAAALLALAGCDRALEPSGGAITVEASIGPLTKVQTSGVSTTFEAGDRLTLYAWTGGAASVPATRVADGVPYTLGADGTWTPAVPLHWQNATDAHYFLGVSPVRSITDFTADAFSPDPADYAASDLLIATNFGTGGAGLKDTGAAVPLTFHHAMARLDVNLRFRSEWTSVPAADQVGVIVTAKSGATVNYLTQAVTAAGSAGAVPMLASAAAGGYHLGFKSIQVPQEGVRRISLTVDGMDYVYEAAEDIPLESGKFTTLSLVLGKDKLELADVAVSDWTEIADLPGGEASGTWDLATPLTIEAIEAGAQVTFTFSTVVAENSVQYRTWSGAAWGDWTTYTGGTAITLTNVGDKLQFRGDNASYASDADRDYSNIQFDKDCYVYGNIMSLITSTGYSTATTLTGSYSFCKLFHYNIRLKSHATNQLLLPATTLAECCYESMFEGCVNLTSTPVLPATTLATACYKRMFCGCNNLTTAPALSATTLADYCYESMFEGCVNLTSTPVLPATTLAEWCYSSMFSNCTSLTTAPALPAETLAAECYYYMFRDCTSLTTAPAELPATTLAERCYFCMFAGCISLTTAPALPAETLAKACYSCMFAGCSSLTTAPALPATTLAEACYYFMFDVCTSLTAAPVLPATTLTKECYYGMFRDCSKLASVTCLATDISASECTKGWLKNAGRDVSGQKTFTTPSSTAWQMDSDSGIPTGWTRVDYVAPVAP